jgi:hypothetical protein
VYIVSSQARVARRRGAVDGRGALLVSRGDGALGFGSAGVFRELVLLGADGCGV